jgi:Arc/MetJ-type ribon-helix-helix transcriptional regulator
MVITEDEVKAIDDWRFAHRIPSRSEAIRRLCQMAIRYDDQERGLMSALRDTASVMKATRAQIKDRRKAGQEIDDAEFLKELYRKLHRSANRLMHQAQIGRLQNAALSQGGDIKEAIRIADEKRAELDAMYAEMVKDTQK